MNFNRHSTAVLALLALALPGGSNAALAEPESTKAQSATMAPPMQPKPRTLTGGVMHSASMPSVEERMRVGKKFTKEMLPSFDKANPGTWYRIPNWMAARVWLTEQCTNYYREDLKNHNISDKKVTFTDRSEETIGWEKDAAGNIWHYDDSPYVVEVKGDDSYTFQVSYEKEPMDLTDDKFIERSNSTHIEVNKKDDVIKRVFQTEQIITYTKVADGVIKSDFSSKNFDPDGQAIDVVRGYEIKRLVDKFEPVHKFKGRDMKAVFYQFLVQDGKADLVPAQ